MRLEPRGDPSWSMRIASPVLAGLLTIALGTGLFWLLGKDPAQGLKVFLLEPVRDAYAWSELAVKGTPLLLCALGLAICYRANVWNIGAEGQFVAGAISAGGVAMMAPESLAEWFVPLILLAGVAGGLCWASIIAWLRDRFNANEILVSLMLVYVAQLLLGYLVYGPWRDPAGYNFPQTPMFSAGTAVPIVAAGTRMHAGALVALLLVPLVWIFLFRSLRGFELSVGGLAPAAASYAGFSARRALWTAMLVSGGLAGLAGAFEAAGPLGQLTPNVSANYGFAAIIVAFVGRLHPVGVLLATLLMSIFHVGGELAQSRLGLPNALTGVFQGLLLISLLACDTLVHFRVRWSR